MITITNIEEHEDGSCSMTFNMDDKSLIEFAKIGLIKVLKDSAESSIQNSKKVYIPCNISNPKVMCDGCDCWKNAREYSS